MSKIQRTPFNTKSVGPHILVCVIRILWQPSTYYTQTKCHGFENNICVIRVFSITDFVLTKFHCSSFHDSLQHNLSPYWYIHSQKSQNLYNFSSFWGWIFLVRALSFVIEWEKISISFSFRSWLDKNNNNNKNDWSKFTKRLKKIHFFW